MLPGWLTAIFSILSPVISVLTFYLKIKGQRQKENDELKKSISDGLKAVDRNITQVQKELTQEITEMHQLHDKDIAALRLEFEKQYQEIFERIDERRRKDTKDLHTRIDEFQSGFASEVMERIGKLEGSITGKIASVENIMTIIQTHLIEKGGK
ncbi:MAG: hypothetical protein IJ855_05445 [Bacteroidales bacterium]|nr:hypothetical protein [Bacteroidales bacterium]